MNSANMLRSVPMVAGLALLSACGGTDEASGQASSAKVSLFLPAFIAEVRAVNPAALTPTLTVDGSQVSMTQNGEVWQATVAVSPNTSHSINLRWQELYRGRQLILGEYSEDISVGDAAQSFNIDSTAYDTAGFDLDGDGVSNLAERDTGTNPFLDNTLAASVDVSIPRLAEGRAAPTLDGRLSSGEWRYAVTADTSGSALLINNLMFEEFGGADLANGVPQSRWSAIHDGEYLYLLVVADDNGIRRFDSVNAWDDDNLNVYLDGQYSHTTSYNVDGAQNDFHLLIPMLTGNGEPNSSANDNSRFELGVNSAPITGLDFSFANRTESSGEQGARGNPMDVYEFRIALSALDTAAGERLGIDLHLDDDDNGGDRDSKWAWFHPSGFSQLTNDFTYQNPTYMAAAALER